MVERFTSVPSAAVITRCNSVDRDGRRCNHDLNEPALREGLYRSTTRRRRWWW